MIRHSGAEFFERPVSSRSVILFFSVVYATFLVGCAPSPRGVVERVFEAASDGDAERAWAYFTDDSAGVMGGLAGLGMETLEFPSSPASVTFGETVLRKNALKLRTDDGTFRLVDLAVVEVESGGETLRFPLIEERGRWKIDLFTLEELWHRNANIRSPMGMGLRDLDR